jgi:hypothetical protein
MGTFLQLVTSSFTSCPRSSVKALSTMLELTWQAVQLGKGRMGRLVLLPIKALYLFLGMVSLLVLLFASQPTHCVICAALDSPSASCSLPTSAGADTNGHPCSSSCSFCQLVHARSLGLFSMD